MGKAVGLPLWEVPSLLYFAIVYDLTERRHKHLGALVKHHTTRKPTRGLHGKRNERTEEEEDFDKLVAGVVVLASRAQAKVTGTGGVKNAFNKLIRQTV